MTDTGFEDIETALEASVTEARAPLRFRLVVTSGRGTPNEIIIDEAAPSRVLVGKSPVCSLIVDDPEVSRRHFSLEATLHGLRISDLDSTNGTRVEGLRVREAWLSGGETIRIGQTTFSVASERFEIGRPGPANAEAGFGRLIGQSSAMRKLYPLCRRVAASKVPMVIEGETGTGKEVLAESVHDESARARMPFVVFDCTTISSTSSRRARRTTAPG